MVGNFVASGKFGGDKHFAGSVQVFGRLVEIKKFKGQVVGVVERIAFRDVHTERIVEAARGKFEEVMEPAKPIKVYIQLTNLHLATMGPKKPKN